MTLVKFRNNNGLRQPSFDRAFGSFGIPSLFSEAFDRLWSEENENWMPSVNIKEREKDFKIDLAVPGMEKKDFSIEVENGLLTVKGERREEKTEETDKITRREFHYGSFRRSFTLPENANAEAINASYRDGILSLTVAKQEDPKSNSKKLISIE